LAGCGAAAGSPGPAGASAAPPISGSPFVGKPAPALDGATLDGAAFRLADLQGKPVVLNFWASWCPPCRDEFPLLSAAAAKYEPQGLVLVGALYRDDAAPARDFVAEKKATWATVTDPDGSHGRAYGIVGPPETFFIDRTGVVRDVNIGAIRDAATLDALIASILQ
jgi:cytochrome c biogenesis protein CcmG/thiol:disulfide interchange protein DsbE